MICYELGKGATSETGNISSELLLCGEGVSRILLLPLVARCLKTHRKCVFMAHDCFYVRCNDFVWSVGMGMFVVLRSLLNIFF